MALDIINNIIGDLAEEKTKKPISMEDRVSVKKLNIIGLCAAVFTPFNENNQINPMIVAQQAEYLYKTGVKAVFVAGTTGESTSLTISEKKQILKEWMDIAPKYRFTVIFHVGTNCIKDSCELAMYGESIGVDAVAVMPPCFFKPSCIESLVLTIKEIADSVPLLPVYYYHIPSMSGVPLNMFDFFVSADQVIPNLVGLKDTGLYDNLSFPILQKLINYKNGQRFEIMTGRDEMILQCLVSGAVGFVGSQYNFAGKLYNKLIKEYNNGNINEARQLSLDINSLLDVQIKSGVGPNKNATKYIMNCVGVNVGECRLPFIPITDKEKSEIHKNLTAWCKQTKNEYMTLNMKI